MTAKSSAVRGELGPDAGLRPVSPPRGFIAGTRFAAKEIIGHRELLVLLVKREVKSKYKDSSLGVLWSLFRPITQLAIYFVVIGQFLGAARSIPDFAIFVFTGLTAWTLFAETLSSTTTSIISNSGLVKKIYVPREIFPLATAGASLFTFVTQLAILVAATILFSKLPNIANLPYLMLGFLVLCTYSFALGLLFAAINVYMRDLQHLVEVLLLIMFWASPVVYSYALVSDTLGTGILHQIYLANPITLGVLGFQKALWASGEGQPWPASLELNLVIAFAVGLIFLWIAQRVFARLEGNFAQEL